MATNQNQTGLRSEEIPTVGAQSRPLKIEVSGYRKVILGYATNGFLCRRWAYGPQWPAARVTADGVHVAPHREIYTDADAQAVADYVNQRVSP